MNIREEVGKMKKDAPFLAASPIEDRNRALEKIAENLKAHKEDIFQANDKDLEEAEKNEVSAAVIKRLKFNEAKLKDVLSGIEQLIKLEDPLEKVTLACESTNIASIKTIESLGGILNSSEIDPSDGILTNIYIINVKETINKYKNI